MTNDTITKAADIFGYSATAKVLDEKFGYTAQNVYNQVNELLAEYK